MLHFPKLSTVNSPLLGFLSYALLALTGIMASVVSTVHSGKTLVPGRARTVSIIIV
jgi:hypothetical protein